MKKTNYIFTSSMILLTFSLIAFGVRGAARGRLAQPVQANQPVESLLQTEPLNPNLFNPALVGLKGLRIVIPEIPQTLMGLGPSIERKLADTDPRLATLLKNGYAAGITPVPQITISIIKTMLTPNRPPVFCVSTILSANVPVLTGVAGTTIYIDVNVWSRSDSIQAPNINAELAAVTTLVNKHIDEFISDFMQVNSALEISADANRPNTQAGQPNLTEPNTPSLTGQYNYIASRNQLVFHKLDCPLAKNILVKNRVYFTTRDEAIAAGKKPCARCKP